MTKMAEKSYLILGQHIPFKQEGEGEITDNEVETFENIVVFHGLVPTINIVVENKKGNLTILVDRKTPEIITNHNETRKDKMDGED